MVIRPPPEGGRPRATQKIKALYKNTNLLLEKMKLDLSVKKEEFVRQCEASDPISKTSHQGPKGNQRERVI